MKKKVTNIAIILLLFVLVLIVRAEGSLLFVQTKKSNDIYNEGDKVVVRDKFGNFIVTNIFISNGDGTYLTKQEDAHYIENFRSDKNNIIGLYSFRLKHFFSFFESKITRFFFMLIAIGIVLKIRDKYIRKQEKLKRVKTYTQTTKEPL